MSEWQFPQPYSPLQGLTTGIMQGAQLAGMLGNKKNNNVPNIPVPNPGERPQVNPRDLLQQDFTDLQKYKEDLKRVSKLDKSQADVLMNDLANNRTPIVKAFYRGGIDPKDVEDVFKKVINNDPDAMSYLNVLKVQMGADGAKAIDTKLAQAKKAQQQLDEQYNLKLKDSLLWAEETRKDIKDQTYKGQVSPELQKAISSNQEGQWLTQLWQSGNSEDRQWIKDYLNTKQQRIQTRAGRAPQNFVGWTRDKARVPISASSIEEAQALHPELSGIRLAGKEADSIGSEINFSVEKKNITKQIAQKYYDETDPSLSVSERRKIAKQNAEKDNYIWKD